MKTNWIHPFEKSGHGKAPFRCIGFEVRKYQACHGAPIQCGTSCDVCGTGIMNVYLIRSADGHTFKVGCDCVQKTGDTELSRSLRTARREWINRDYIAARKAEREAHAVRVAELAARMETEYAFGLALLRRIATDRPEVAGIANWAERRILLGCVDDTAEMESDDAIRFWRAVQSLSVPGGQYVGKPGDRIRNVTATYVRSAYYDTMYGRTYVETLVTDDGSVLVWKGAGIHTDETGRRVELGDRVRITGTVKRHGKYKGEKQTELSRCKVVR